MLFRAGLFHSKVPARLEPAVPAWSNTWPVSMLCTWVPDVCGPGSLAVKEGVQQGEREGRSNLTEGTAQTAWQSLPTSAWHISFS